MMLTFLDTLKLIKAVTTVGYEISNIIYTKEQGYKGEDLINFYKKLTHQTIFRKKKNKKIDINCILQETIKKSTKITF